MPHKEFQTTQYSGQCSRNDFGEHIACHAYLMQVSMISILSTHDMLRGNVINKKLCLISMLSNRVGYFRGDMPPMWSPRPSGAYKEVSSAAISLMDSTDTPKLQWMSHWPCRKSKIQGWEGRGSASCGRTHGYSCLCLYMVFTNASRHHILSESLGKLLCISEPQSCIKSSIFVCFLPLARTLVMQRENKPLTTGTYHDISWYDSLRWYIVESI